MITLISLFNSIKRPIWTRSTLTWRIPRRTTAKTSNTNQPGAASPTRTRRAWRPLTNWTNWILSPTTRPPWSRQKSAWTWNHLSRHKFRWPSGRKTTPRRCRRRLGAASHASLKLRLPRRTRSLKGSLALPGRRLRPRDKPCEDFFFY